MYITRNCSGQGRFLGMGTLINVLCMAHKRKALQGKSFVFFLQDALKTAFFQNQDTFFPIFKKGQGRPLPLFPTSCASELRENEDNTIKTGQLWSFKSLRFDINT